MACFGLEEQAGNNMDAKRVTASIAVNRIFIELPPLLFILINLIIYSVPVAAPLVAALTL
ncbi:hypothetical protein D3C72_2565020 [compost metagenome]